MVFRLMNKNKRILANSTLPAKTIGRKESSKRLPATTIKKQPPISTVQDSNKLSPPTKQLLALTLLKLPPANNLFQGKVQSCTSHSDPDMNRGTNSCCWRTTRNTSETSNRTRRSLIHKYPSRFSHLLGIPRYSTGCTIGKQVHSLARDSMK